MPDSAGQIDDDLEYVSELVEVWILLKFGDLLA